jgi:hypothetical protein
MKKRSRVWSAIALMTVAAGCAKSSPTRPSDTGASSQVSAINDAKTGVTLTTPQPQTPTSGQRLKFADQPLTLTVKNGVTTGVTALTYTFQVASDAGFASVVYSKDGVAEGAGGQTSLNIDKLAGNKDYFWRVRAATSAVTGLFSAARAFNVGPEVVIQAPALASPSQNGTLNGSASLVAMNAAKSGPAGQIFYRFEVSDSSSFANLVFVSTVAEQSGQTSVQMTARLTTNAAYFWRVQASDPANGVTGPYSSVYSFRYAPFDMTQAVILSNPPDLPYWPETTKITLIQFRPDALIVDFDKRAGDGHWPNLPFAPGGPVTGGGIQYTLGACFKIGGPWYCSAVIQFWEGRDLEAAAAPSSIPYTWYYDPGRWGAMTGYVPADGEIIGLFVTVGNTRGILSSDLLLAKERSNVALVPFDSGSGSTYTFSNGVKTSTVRRSR